jgi:hypothetical protein
MRSALRTISTIDLARPIWSPSTACAMLFGYPQYVRTIHSLANAEDLGSHATEKRM